MTVQDSAERLSEHCQDAFGERLRAVTRYSADEHDPIYTREGIPREIQLAEDERQMFRHPLLQLNKGLWRLSRIHPTLGRPETATYTFGDVVALQFPISDSEGIIATFDRGDGLSEEVVSRCESIVYGRG